VLQTGYGQIVEPTNTGTKIIGARFCCVTGQPLALVAHFVSLVSLTMSDRSEDDSVLTHLLAMRLKACLDEQAHSSIFIAAP
jgi:hypothetical protein